MNDLFHTVVYQPIYNALIFFIGVLPGADAGLAVVAVTLLVKIVLLPVSFSMARTQKRMQVLQPRLKELQTLHKEDKEKQMRETMALYKEHKINPFGSIIILIIQLPIIFALYHVVLHLFAGVDTALLYPFVAAPAAAATHFLGLIDIAHQSLFLALLTGLSQVLFSLVLMPKLPAPAAAGEKPSISEDMQRAMAVQMRYMLPVLMAVIGYVAGGAIALYLITSNVFGIAQQLVVNHLHPDPVKA